MTLSRRRPKLLDVVVVGALVAAVGSFATSWFIADDPFCWRGYFAYDGTCAWE